MAPGHASKHQKWSKASKMSLKFVPNLPPGNQKDKPPTIQASKPRVLEVGGRGGSLFNVKIIDDVNGCVSFTIIVDETRI